MFNGRISQFNVSLDSMGKIYKDNGNNFLCRQKSETLKHVKQMLLYQQA